MTCRNAIVAFFTFLLIAAPRPVGDDETILPIWPDRAPGIGEDVALENEYEESGRAIRVVHPTLTVMRPPEGKANGTSVVVFPGGGYNILAVEHEGYDVGRWLNELGVTAFVLQYRVPRAEEGPHWLPPLQDAQRAIRYVRTHAEQWDLDPQRIGVLGFSAGGHLAATSSTRFDRRTYAPIDSIDAASPRPDFSLLIYPAYITPSETTRQKSEEITVTEETPPAFLTVTADDDHALSSLFYTMALREHDVPVELHVYPEGGHGYGLGRGDHAVNRWPTHAERWLQDRGLID